MCFRDSQRVRGTYFTKMGRRRNEALKRNKYVSSSSPLASVLFQKVEAVETSAEDFLDAMALPPTHLRSTHGYASVTEPTMSPFFSGALAQVHN